MRLNPFTRPKNGRGGNMHADDSRAEEDIAITRLKNKRHSTSGRSRREGQFDPPPESSSSGRANLSYAGGSAVARGRTASRSRGDGRAPSASLRDLPPGARAVVRARSRGRSVNSKRDVSSSPEPVSRSQSRGTKSKRSSIARDRDVSSSPEPDMESRRKMKSRSSLRSRAPPSPPSSDSDDSGPGIHRHQRREQQLRRTSSRASSRRSRGRMPPPPPPTAMELELLRRRSGSSRFMEGGGGRDPRRERVSLSRSRSFNSRRAASLAPSSSQRPSYGGPERRRRGSSHRPHPSGRSYSNKAPPARRNFRAEEQVPIKKSMKKGFKSFFGLGKGKKEDTRDDIADDDNSSIESFQMANTSRDAPIMSDDDDSTPPMMALRQKAAAGACTGPANAIVDNSYTVPKREAYANLYEFDNFPAIDRVPTAIGYTSDDSTDEVMVGGNPVPVVADDKSVTSRYSIDVRSVRSSKLKHHSGDPDSDNDNDDKYSQYLGRNNSIPLDSDDSDSCRPQWHHALDQDDSDWYDDYDEDDEDAMKKASKTKNKKYQVSGNRKKKSRQEKGEPSAEETIIADLKGEPGPGDAIVANRSEEQQGNKVPRQEELEEDLAGIRRRQKRGGKAGRKNRFDDATMDEDDDDSLSDEESGDETTRKDRKTDKSKMIKEKGIIMNTHGKSAVPKSAKKGKAKGFASRFRAFGRRNAGGYGSDSDESEISESVRLAQSQSMFSEDPSSRRTDPVLNKLEEDERRESTATHNIIRNKRKEIAELDEMDELSLGSNHHQASCFPFSLPAMNLGAGLGTSSAPAQTSSTFCWYPSSGQTDPNDLPLDDVQIQRLKDMKYGTENKPKVEVILQDLQDPLADKYDQLEKAQRKKKSELQKEKELHQEIERREREELLRMKREMREMEQKKLQMLQHKDALALQEAPDLKRGKNQSFVMDISDWVLKLDNNDTPHKSPKDTPRTNGRDGSTDPLEKLPFSTIEVPTTTTVDSGDYADSTNGSSWGRRKNRYNDDESQSNSRQRSRSASKTKTAPKKKKGWFRRG